MEKPIGSGSAQLNQLLWSWLSERGARVHDGIAPAPIGDTGLWGIVARKPIEPQRVLLEVPASMLFPLDAEAKSSPDIPEEVLRSIPDNIFGSKVPAIQLSRAFDGTGDPKVRAFWRPYIDKLASLTSWKAIPEFVDAFEQSPLRDLAVYASRWARGEVEVEGVRPGRGLLNRSLYLHANYCILSRIHGTDSKDGRALVPGGDLFNHHFNNNADWDYDNSAGVFQITANRALKVGEEILISYGTEESNERLMDKHGFTQPPYWEPFSTFKLHFEEGPDGGMLPPTGAGIGVLTKQLTLKTPVVLDGAGPASFHQSFWKFLAVYSSSWKQAIRSHLDFHLERYDGDVSLAPLRDTWRANRQQNPHTAVWWTPLPSCRSDFGAVDALDDPPDCSKERDLSAELAGGSFVAESVLRVKMSEYVALTAWSEALEILEGRRAWQKSLMAAAGLSDLLKYELERPARPEEGVDVSSRSVEATSAPDDVGASHVAVLALAASGALCVALVRHRWCWWMKKGD